MSIVRYKGTIMTATKYTQVKQVEAEQLEQEETANNLMEWLNLFFFGAKEIALSDWLWFYGTIIYCFTVVLFCYIVTL